MAASRRPTSSRRPAPRGRATVRTTTAPPRRTPEAAAAEPRGPRALTTRAAVLGLVVCGLLVSAALPLREYLAQREEIARAQQANDAAAARVKDLERLRQRLNDPAYVKAQAREKLFFVLPGETSFLILSDKKPSAAPTPVATKPDPAAPVAPDAPWYSQLYGTVQAADER